MACPACRMRFDAPAERCPNCGFTGADTVAMFPYAARALEPVIDAAGILDAAGTERIRRRIRALSRRFRQLHWCVCTVRLPRSADPRLFAFWLLNSAPCGEVEGEAPNAWTVLLVVDAARGLASVGAGYAIEPFVGDDTWTRCLEPLAEAWSAAGAGHAVGAFLDAAERELVAAARRADRIMTGGGAP